MPRRALLLATLVFLTSCSRGGGSENRRIAATFAEAVRQGDTATIRRLAVRDQASLLAKSLLTPCDERLKFAQEPPLVQFRGRQGNGVHFFVASSTPHPEGEDVGLWIVIRDGPVVGVVSYQPVPDLYHPPPCDSAPPNMRLKLSARRRHFCWNAQGESSILSVAPAGRSLSATR
jgi:hypothetical protein